MLKAGESKMEATQFDCVTRDGHRAGSLDSLTASCSINGGMT